MILKQYISELVTCRDCRYADLQDYFRLYDFSGDGHDIHFICDPCYDKRCPAPLPESLYKPIDRKLSRDTVKGLVIASALMIVGCAMVIYFAIYPIAGGGK